MLACTWSLINCYAIANFNSNLHQDTKLIDIDVDWNVLLVNKQQISNWIKPFIMYQLITTY